MYGEKALYMIGKQWNIPFYLGRQTDYWNGHNVFTFPKPDIEYSKL